jgi:hypothetical protein
MIFLNRESYHPYPILEENAIQISLGLGKENPWNHD